MATLQLGPVLVLLLMIAVASQLSSVFLTDRNVDNLLLQSSVIALVALGQLLVILTRGIDLSVGSTLALATVVGAMLARSGDSTLFVILGMLGTGLGIGLINGLLVVRVKLEPFIVTLAMLSVASGIALQLSNGETIPHVPSPITEMANGKVLGIPEPAALVLIVAAVVFALTRGMRWGRWIYATGGNPEAASRVGIPVPKVLISVYALSGVCAAIGGIVVSGRTGTGYPTAGQLVELDSISAVIIGGASFFGGRGGVSAALVGALTIGVIRNALDVMSVGVFWQLIVIGVILLMAVKLDTIRRALEARLRVARTESE